YSLSPQSLDEQVSRDVLLNRLPELPAPSLIVVVVDGSNLQRNLYYTTQVIELGHPTIVALNMVDVARSNGHEISSDKLAELLGVAVVPIIASNGTGITELKQQIIRSLDEQKVRSAQCFCDLPQVFEKEIEELAARLATEFRERQTQARAEALLLLTNEKALASSLQHYSAHVQLAVAAARNRLDAAGADWRGAPIEARYRAVAEIQAAATTELAPPGETFSDKLDRVLTHKVWGTLIFVGIMALMFQSIFSFARLP